MFNLTDVLNPNTADHDYSCFNRFYLADQITVIGIEKSDQPFNRRCRIYSGFHFVLAH